jgi:hypothetical protein
MDSLEDIERFEAGHNNGNPVSLRNRFVFGITHYGAHVTGSQKTLHSITGGGQDRLHRRRDEHMRNQ